jgi:hypothetical protein
VFSAFQERYSRWSVEENIQVFATKEEREKKHGYGKSVDEVK